MIVHNLMLFCSLKVTMTEILDRLTKGVGSPTDGNGGISALWLWVWYDITFEEK